MELTHPTQARYGVHVRRPGGYVVGVDLGQSNDFTAITVNEIVKEHFEQSFDGSPDRIVRHHHLRHAQRLPLGTPYPDVAEFVGNLIKSLSIGERATNIKPALVVDGTGVGKPVIDMMHRLKLNPIGVAITGGREENSGGAFSHSVPKRNLVSSLIVTFQEGRLKLASGIPAIRILENELVNFKARVSASGHETFDAWRDSIHDDLVLSLALAVWWGERNAQAARFMNKLDFLPPR